MTEDSAAQLREGLKALLGANHGITQAQQEQLLRLLEELTRWNRVHNLTAVRAPREMVSRHLLDSLSVLPFVERAPILDVGSGAGLPGLPVAIVRPEWPVTLLDSNIKKTRFQRHAVRTLALDNVTPVHQRVEAFQPHQAFNTVLARAWASISEIAGLCGRMCQPGGQIIAMKGRYPTDELKKKPPDFDITAVERVQVPGSDAERHIVVLTRQGPS